MAPALILIFFINMLFTLAVGIALLARTDTLEERIEDLETDPLALVDKEDY